MHIIVVVLGDLGRSPRMQYHCQSLLEAGHSVSAVGYEGEALIPALRDAGDRLHTIRFTPPLPPQAIRSIKLLYFIWRILSVAACLTYALFVRVNKEAQPIDFVLVQNPPALPLLAVAYAFCRIKSFTQGRRPGLIIDWHNLGWSMLSDGSPVQQIAQVYERFMAPLANGHLTVTKAMAEFLRTDMNVSLNVGVLYDCPPEMFQPLDVKEQHEILSKLDKQLCQACPRSWHASNTADQTLFTEQLKGKFQHRPGRPALVTSSTSWTPDEDFGVLLSALQLLDKKINDSDSSLNVLVVVTGKGPEREMYEERISRMKLLHVAVATLWLEAEDYPSLLACADLGVSLHTSTSGLDLPMKVLDLFGCEVPALAHDFECLHELVQDKVNGRVFGSSGVLADQLDELLLPLDDRTSVANHSYGALQTYSEQLQGRNRWNANWHDNAFPVMLRATPM